MNWVHGDTLELLLSEIGWRCGIKIAWQLRGYLRLMRGLASESAGGISSGCVLSHWFLGLYLPVYHALPVTLAGYLNWWLTCCHPYRFKPCHDLTLKPRQNVLVHQDLVPHAVSTGALIGFPM
jgi:hypothetical protein